MRFNVVFAVRQLNVLIFSDDSIHSIKQLIRHRLSIKSVMFMVASSVVLTYSNASQNHQNFRQIGPFINDVNKIFRLLYLKPSYTF